MLLRDLLRNTRLLGAFGIGFSTDLAIPCRAEARGEAIAETAGGDCGHARAAGAGISGAPHHPPLFPPSAPRRPRGGENSQ